MSRRGCWGMSHTHTRNKTLTVRLLSKQRCQRHSLEWRRGALPAQPGRRCLRHTSWLQSQAGANMLLQRKGRLDT